MSWPSIPSVRYALRGWEQRRRRRRRRLNRGGAMAGNSRGTSSFARRLALARSRRRRRRRHLASSRLCGYSLWGTRSPLAQTPRRQTSWRAADVAVNMGDVDEVVDARPGHLAPARRLEGARTVGWTCAPPLGNFFSPTPRPRRRHARRRRRPRHRRARACVFFDHPARLPRVGPCLHGRTAPPPREDSRKGRRACECRRATR